MTAGLGDREAVRAFLAEVEAVAARLAIPVELESPGDVIPTPKGAESRTRPASESAGRHELRHFDPYSTSLRYLARGDEFDYQLVLDYLERGWMTMEELDRMLSQVLPLFTRRTIFQDRAEFRRRYRGLQQMWRARMR